MNIFLRVLSVIVAVSAGAGFLALTALLAEQAATGPSAQWIWGAPTNGVVGSVFVEQPSKATGTIEVEVYVHAFDTNAPSSFLAAPTNSKPHPNAIFSDMPMMRGWGVYFKPTNSFCGPVELHDADLRTMPSSKPELCSTQAYPAFFRSKQLGHLPGNPFKGRIAEPLIGRLPNLARFDLKDYFDVEPGEYVLTIWPKVYKQVKEDDDLCVLVDLPPISVKIVMGSAHY